MVLVEPWVVIRAVVPITQSRKLEQLSKLPQINNLTTIRQLQTEALNIVQEECKCPSKSRNHSLSFISIWPRWLLANHQWGTLQILAALPNCRRVIKFYYPRSFVERKWPAVSRNMSVMVARVSYLLVASVTHPLYHRASRTLSVSCYLPNPQATSSLSRNQPNSERLPPQHLK